MLLIKFKIGNEYYALDTNEVIEIIPAITLRPIPGTPDFFAGIFDYRGQIVPVIDITQLTINKPSVMRLSTRIVLLNFPFQEKNMILGLMVEDLTDVVEIDEANFQDTGIASEKAQYLGAICEYENSFIQLVQMEKLFSQDIQKKIFSYSEVKLFENQK